MPSNKRRRTIGIHVELFEMLEGESDHLGVSPTRLVSMILKGEIGPVSGGYSPSKNKSVSMPEYLWHALKDRAKSNGTPAQHLGRQILTGIEPPLTADEIQLGMDFVSTRELEVSKSRPKGISIKSIDSGILDTKSDSSSFKEGPTDREKEILEVRISASFEHGQNMPLGMSPFEQCALIKRFGKYRVMRMMQGPTHAPDHASLNDNRFSDILYQWADLASPPGSKMTEIEKELLAKRFGICANPHTAHQAGRDGSAPSLHVTTSEEGLDAPGTRARALSAGVRAEAEASDSSLGQIEPGQEYYGGVFSI